MDTRTEIRRFPTSRRAKLEAADVGLPDYGARRAPGLREKFGQHRARHDVRFHISDVERFRPAEVGDVELNHERLDVAFDPRLTFFTCTAEAGQAATDD